MERLSYAVALLAALFLASGCAVAPPARPASTLPAVVATQPVPAQVATPTLTPVPRVVGMAAADARKQLAATGFDSTIEWVRNPKKLGQVIEQTPSGGTAPAGSTVVMVVSRGSAQESGVQNTPATISPGDAAAARAFQQHTSGVELSGQGTVTRVLSDDVSGDRHQRFILRLASGQTLLVAHNIDIAPRIPSLAAGDMVSFKGVYEWNAEGGTVHWTHHDPGGTHEPGWLKRGGQVYQ